MLHRTRHLPDHGVRRFPGASLERFAYGRAVREVSLNPARALAALPKTIFQMGANPATGAGIAFGMPTIDGEHSVPSQSSLRYKASTTSLSGAAKAYKPGNLGLAVRVGFEPTEPAKVQRFSRPPDSTALAPHRTSNLPFPDRASAVVIRQSTPATMPPRSWLKPVSFSPVPACRQSSH